MILVTNSVSVSFLKQSKEEYFEKQRERYIDFKKKVEDNAHKRRK